MPRCLVLLVLLLVAPAALAQRVVVRADSLAALAARSDTLDLRQGPPYRLRTFVRPETVRVKANGRWLPASAYVLDARAGLLVPGVSMPYPLVQLVVAYDTWDVGTDSVASVVAVRRPRDAAAADVLRDPNEASGEVPEAADVGEGLRRSGSITRGVLAGSNRDVTLESGLNLSVEGEVAPGVDIEARLTDANTPLVVEGTTRRLSELDRLYLTVRTKGTQTRLGDLDLHINGGDLVRLGRRVQGGAFDVRFGRAWGGLVRQGHVTVAGAVPRGQFRQQTLAVLDGVQGPYRLEGAAGEPYVLIVPGSEAVYLDGQRLERGADADYTIEYATGEIAFTPRRLLRAEQRLTVEFQYSAQQFARTLVGGRAAADLNLGGVPVSVGATLLREADGLRLGEGLDLTPEDSLLLRQVGGGRTFRSGATRLAAYDPAAPFVQYRAAADGADSVFVALDAAPAAGEAVYRVRFSRVGVGQGRYVRDAAREASGIAYRFVGAGRGDYEPARLLPKPEERTVVGVDVRLRPVRGVDVRLEGARSAYDANRFSPLGGGGGLGYGVDVRLDTLGSARAGVSGQVTRRVRQAGFETFDPVRPLDFAQRWNVASPGESGAAALLPDSLGEAVDEAALRGWWGPNRRVGVEAGRLRGGDAFEALRGGFEAAFEGARGVQGQYRLDAARSEDRRTESSVIALQKERGGTYVRGGGALQAVRGRWTSSVAVAHEARAQRRGDTLLATSYGFAELRPGVRYAAGADAFVALEGIARRSYAPAAGGLAPAFDGLGVQGSYALRRGTAFAASGRVEVRRRVGASAAVPDDGLEVPDAVAMQHDLRWTALRGGVDVLADYLAQTVRTPKLQEVYLRLTPDLPEARYVWDDRNGNGVRELDEFLLETTPYEGTYARTLLPTDTLVAAAGVSARLRLAVDPARWWRTDSLGGVRRVLRRIATRTTLEVDDRTREPSVWRVYALDPTRLLRAATTLAGRIRAAQDVTVNRNGRVSVDFGASQVRSLSTLAAGREERSLTTLRADARVRISRPLGLRLAFVRDETTAASDRFATRRYRIASRGGEAALSWRPTEALLLGGGAAVAEKTDVEAQRSASVLRLPVEARVSLGTRFNATATLEAAQVALRGAADGEAAYELTEGRGPGRSLLWSVSANAALSRMLTLTAGYDGRAAENAPLVQTLRVQLSASF